MDEQDRLSQASSVVTISSFPVRPQTGEEKVQSFGKRCFAVKRDPNCPVVIRGWLYKKDSTGLKLWKRRWFVLSEYCLFYYKDSREETVLGSIPLPSYSVLFCTPRECKNRKYTFKVVHKGMRTYFFSADTQEDMLGWVRAISQSASMDTESINKRCSSYQDFTQVDSSEFVHVHHNTSLRDVGLQSSRKQTERDERAGSQVENGGGKKAVLMSESSSKEQTDECSLPFLSIPQYFSSYPQSLSSRTQLESRPHTPVGRVDIKPHNDLPPIPPSNKQTLCVERHPHKGCISSQLPPLPSSRLSPNLGNPHYQPPRSHSYICQHLPTLSERYDGFQGSDMHSSKTSDNHVDAVLTKLCGCDKQLQALCAELSHLQVEKESLQAALEVSHIQRDECKYTEAQISQKAMLQDELVTIRARICDVSADMDYVWCQYERMESELAVFRSQLQHACHYGPLQDQHKAQKQLWMMEDILCGLRDNRNHYRLVLGLHDQQGEEVPGHNLEVEMEAPYGSSLTHDIWTAPNICKASRCDSHIYSKPYPCYQEQKQSDWNQGNRINTWPSADPAVNVTRMSNVYKKDCKKATREPDQIEGMNIYEERTDTHKKASVSKLSAAEHDPSSDLQEATAFPLRVTRVITATLPSALIAHRVSVQDPPLELVNPLPEQIPQMLPKRAPNKPTRTSSQYTGLRLQEDERNDMGAQRAARMAHQRNGTGREASLKNRGQSIPSKDQKLAQEVDGDAQTNGLSEEKRNQTVLDLCPEQREAKLKRVERIRQRVIRSVSKENQTDFLPTPNPVLKNTEDSESQVIQDASSSVHSGAEKSLDSFQKHPKHEPHSSVSACTPSTPVEKTDLSNEVDLTEKSSPSNNNRSEWFLSTCEWQGFRPLVNAGLDSCSHNDTRETELEDLSGNSSIQTNKSSAKKKLNLKNIYTSRAKPRSKESTLQVVNEALECQERNKGMEENLCDTASLSPVSVVLTPSVNCSCDSKSSSQTKNENNELSNDLMVASVSSDNCLTCLHRQLNLELSVYEEIPNTEFASLTTEDREGEKQEQNNTCLDVREDVMVGKKLCTQNETLPHTPENSQSQTQPKSNQSLYCTIPVNGLGNHSPFVWSRVTMDRTSL